MNSLGAFTFVIHCHVPYIRMVGRWPQVEERLHDTIGVILIPLLRGLDDLATADVPFRLTLALSPVLAEQLADPQLIARFVAYLDRRIAGAQADIRYFAPEATPGEPHQPDSHLHYLANWYHERFSDLKTALAERFNNDIIGALRNLQDRGFLEIATSAATHAYLPLLGRESAVRAQIRAAVASHKRLFGRAPTSIWLPECGYRPGIERLLAAEGLRLFFAETHAITGGEPVGVAAGEVIGPHSDVRQYLVFPRRDHLEPRTTGTMHPYYAAEGSEHAGVSVLGRDNRATLQVWSTSWGYPGDVDYRETNRRFGVSGLRYWRVTGHRVDLSHKDHYHPDWASYKVDQHAEHFAHLVGDMLREYHNETGRYGLITACFDAPLFGRWWFEGPSWLARVLRHLADSQDIELTTAGAFVDTHPPAETIELPESSWGLDGLHYTWDNIQTHWMWEVVHEAEARMERLADQFTQADDNARTVLDQAARELLLLQSADWPYFVTTRAASDYAALRFSQHAERFEQLAASLEAGQPDRAAAEAFLQLDPIFADMDYRWFRSQQKAADQR